MSKKIFKRKSKQEIDRICNECGEVIETNDIWYPFFDISRCGGGILYLHAHCAVERTANNTKTDMLGRVKLAERDKDDPLSDGLMNFYWVFPISPIHWIKFYALNHDFEEIKQLVEEIENKSKVKTTKQR